LAFRNHPRPARHAAAHRQPLLFPPCAFGPPQRDANGLVCLLLAETRRRPCRYESPLARAFSEMQAPTGPGGVERGPLRGTGDFPRRWRRRFLLWHLLSAGRRMRRSTAGYDRYSSLAPSKSPGPGCRQPRHRRRRAPEVVADRILNFAGVVGRENVIAGTDCGLSGGALRSAAWRSRRRRRAATSPGPATRSS
jgi:hypothetical protein